MNRIRRLLARRAGPPGVVERPASKPSGPAGRRAGRSGPDGVATRFIQDMAAAASMAAGHQLVRPSHRPRPPAAAATGKYDPTNGFRFNHNMRPASDRGGS